MYRYGHIVASEVLVDVHHADSFFFSLLTGSVSRMTFLPEELCRAKEETGAHLPADYVRPLIAQDR